MSIQRYNGATFAEVAARKRWNGSAWAPLTFGRRWNGSAWVDLWNNDDGPSSSGNLFSRLSSTVSRPTVNYAATYAASRSGTALTVTLKFSAWLNSSASRLGSGIKLTAFVRLNGGAWHSVVLKGNADMWKGASTHTVSATLSGSTSGADEVIEFYVSRVGSSYGGTAGTLASAGSPKKFAIHLT